MPGRGHDRGGRQVGSVEDDPVDGQRDLEWRIAAYERGFRRAGVPNLAERYSAAEEIFTRAWPFLTFVLLLEVLNAVNLEWSWWVNVLAFLGGVTVVVAATGLLNLARGRGLLFRLPARVGFPELAVFVAVPAALPLIFGEQWRSALVTAGGQLLLLGLVWLIVGFGLFAIVRWAGRRFLDQLRASLSILVRALPLLLFFALITFFTNEYWQMFGLAHGPVYLTATLLFVALTALFLLVRIPGSIRALEADTNLAVRGLRRRQRINIGLVIFVSQALQVLFVAAAVFVFFLVFGALLVSVRVQADWLGGQPHTILGPIPLIGEQQISLTQELLRTATGVTCFSALYYAVAMTVDATYQDEFVTRIIAEMRQTCADHAEYLKLIAERNRQPISAPS